METITREYLQSLFDSNGTYKAIIEQLGMDPYSGGGYRTLKSYIKRYSIDLETFNSLRMKVRVEQYAGLSKTIKKYTIDNIFQRHVIKVDGKTPKAVDD